ncbi:probable ATP-dependent RNA helicase kurz, partial [Caerostris extrusa]
ANKRSKLDPSKSSVEERSSCSETSDSDSDYSFPDLDDQENPVVLIHGETGSGKTTQFLNSLYEAGFHLTGKKIAITEPRRLAAMSMSARVGEELNMPEKVSYRIRYKKNITKKTEIKFMTDSVLLRELRQDFFLTKYSVIIIDEAHERSVFFRYSDWSFIKNYYITKKAESSASKFKSILIFRHLEDYVESAFSKAKSEIHRLCKLLRDTFPFPKNQSAISTIKERETPSASNAPKNLKRKRKKKSDGANAFILPAKIDLIGKEKTRVFSKNGGLSTFEVIWCSKSSANQRAGRCGRTEGGHCYRLYSSAVFDHEFKNFSVPEIQRVPVDDVVLQIKALGLNRVVTFPFPSPPDQDALKAAERRLVWLEALEKPDESDKWSSNGELWRLVKSMGEEQPQMEKCNTIKSNDGKIPRMILKLLTYLVHIIRVSASWTSPGKTGI